jgi:hypothetical protein
MMRRVAVMVSVLVLLATPVLAQDAQIVAIAATPSGDGVLTVPIGGVAAFAWAALNYGRGTAILGAIAAPGLPGTLIQVLDSCLTNPKTGACLGGNPIVTLAPGEVVTGSVFVTVTDGGPSLDGSFSRVVVELIGTNVLGRDGAIYTATSVAVRTP